MEAVDRFQLREEIPDYFYIVTAYPYHTTDGEEQYQYIQPYCQYIIRRGYPRRAISYQQQVFQFYRILLEKQEDAQHQDVE